VKLFLARVAEIAKLKSRRTLAKSSGQSGKRTMARLGAQRLYALGNQAPSKLQNSIAKLPGAAQSFKVANQ